jgi:hypothetical protein
MQTKRDKMGHQLEQLDPHKPNSFLQSLNQKKHGEK